MIMRMTTSLSLKMNNGAVKELSGTLDGTWSNQQNEQQNDACHLGAEGFPLHQNLKMFLTQNPALVMLERLSFTNLRAKVSDLAQQ